MLWLLGPSASLRRRVHADCHTSRSFRASWARCTQFCLTVHADEAWCTQFFAGPERRAASSTCAFDASRSFWGLINCVHRAPVACSVGGNCVYRAPLACSVGRNCVYRALEVCARTKRPPLLLLCLSCQQVTAPLCVSRTSAHTLPRVSRPPTYPNAQYEVPLQPAFWLTVQFLE